MIKISFVKRPPFGDKGSAPKTSLSDISRTVKQNLNTR